MRRLPFLDGSVPPHRSSRWGRRTPSPLQHRRCLPSPLQHRRCRPLRPQHRRCRPLRLRRRRRFQRFLRGQRRESRPGRRCPESCPRLPQGPRPARLPRRHCRSRYRARRREAGAPSPPRWSRRTRVEEPQRPTATSRISSYSLRWMLGSLLRRTGRAQYRRVPGRSSRCRILRGRRATSGHEAGVPSVFQVVKHPGPHDKKPEHRIIARAREARPRMECETRRGIDRGATSPRRRRPRSRRVSASRPA